MDDTQEETSTDVEETQEEVPSYVQELLEIIENPDEDSDSEWSDW
jgi:hypothetical protein